MKRNERLSVALHVLIHLAAHPDAPLTSERMAECAGTNPVVIRRTLAGLRQAGIVASSKGHGGGWRLARPPETVSLADVQRALGERVASVGPPEESPGCLVERVVHAALDDAVAAANRVLDARLAAISLAEIVAEVQAALGGPFSLGLRNGTARAGVGIELPDAASKGEWGNV